MNTLALEGVARFSSLHSTRIADADFPLEVEFLERFDDHELTCLRLRTLGTSIHLYAGAQVRNSHHRSGEDPI